MNKAIVFGLVALIVLLSGCTEEGGGIPFFPSEQKLNPPKDLSATATDQTVQLAWNANNESLEGYNVYRSIVSGKDYLKANQQLVAATNFADTDLANDITYFYVVTAIGKDGKESAYSNEVNATPKIGLDENVSGGVSLDECNAKPNQLQKDLCFQALALENLETSICSNIKSISPDRCYYDIAVKLIDQTVCEKISVQNRTLRNECFNDIAIKLNNKEICERILENDVLRNSCIKTVSTALQETEGCAAIGDLFEKDDCYEQLAVAQLNPSFCTLMSNTLTPNGFVRDVCLDNILLTKKETIVSSYYLSSSEKNECYKTVAVALSNETICSQIADQNKQDYCFNEVNIALKQVSICYAIVDEDLRYECIEAAALANPSRENCELVRPSNARDTCFYTLATSINDHTLCDGINFDLDLKDECNKTIAISLKDSTICPKIRSQNPELRNQCYQAIAIANLDLALCVSCTTSTYYIGCFVGIAQAINNDSACQNATKNFQDSDYTSQDRCYYNFATATNNSSTCSRILNSTLRGYCDANVSG